MRTPILPTFGFILALLQALSASGQVYSFRLVHKDTPVHGSFQVDMSPSPRMDVVEFADSDPRQVNLKFSHLEFNSAALNRELKLLVRSSDFKISGGALLNANFGLTLKPGQVLTVPVTLEKSRNISISFHPGKYRYYDPEGASPAESDLESAETFQIKFETKTTSSKAEPAETPQDNNNGENKNAAERPAARQQMESRPAPDLEAFQKALASKDRVEELKTFLRKFKNSDKAAEARRFVPIERSLTKLNDTTYRYLLRYAINPQLDSIANAGSVRIVELFHKYDNGHVLELVYRRGAPATLFLSDPAKENEDLRRDTIALSSDMSILQCELIALGAARYALKLTGGVPPFRLDFFYNDERIIRLSQPIPFTDTTISLNTNSIRDIWENHGALTMMVVQRKENLSTEVTGQLDVPEPQNPLLYIGIGLGVLLLLFLIYRIRQRAAYQATKAKIEKAQGEKADSSAGNEAGEPTAEPVPEAPLQPGSSILKIRQTTTAAQLADKKSLTEEAFDELLAKGGYHQLRLTEHWLDTALIEIHASKKSIVGIDSFLRGQRTTQLEEPEGTLPEIGGFLLGKYTVSQKTQQYRVALEEFVPIVPEEHNVYQLHFSTESLVRELGDMQDEYPELSLVGWFHTHPGHGLFLSKPDMTIHDGFFREPYQFAMEIDPLTENLDTGFFTRTKAGTVNNQEARLPDTRWFEWTEIEKATRRK